LARGAVPRAELIGSHLCNSAFHASLLDKEHIATEFAAFLDKMETHHGLDRAQLASQLLYVAHETGTSANGGCAKAEMDLLRRSFGKHQKNVLVTNTKGFTGHPMGVSFEDVVAVACLEQGKVPPIPNYQVRDTRLGEVLLSRGGTHARTYALRFAAGFGSQFVFLLFRKWMKKTSGVASSNEAQNVAASSTSPLSFSTSSSSSSAAAASLLTAAAAAASVEDQPDEDAQSFLVAGGGTTTSSSSSSSSSAAASALLTAAKSTQLADVKNTAPPSSSAAASATAAAAASATTAAAAPVAAPAAAAAAAEPVSPYAHLEEAARNPALAAQLFAARDKTKRKGTGALGMFQSMF
jgi:hypothetical protein